MESFSPSLASPLSLTGSTLAARYYGGRGGLLVGMLGDLVLIGVCV